jgi:hypothetical protein
VICYSVVSRTQPASFNCAYAFYVSCKLAVTYSAALSWCHLCVRLRSSHTETIIFTGAKLSTDVVHTCSFLHALHSVGYAVALGAVTVAHSASSCMSSTTKHHYTLQTDTAAFACEAEYIVLCTLMHTLPDTAACCTAYRMHAHCSANVRYNA